MALRRRRQNRQRSQRANRRNRDQDQEIARNDFVVEDTALAYQEITGIDEEIDRLNEEKFNLRNELGEEEAAASVRLEQIRKRKLELGKSKQTWMNQIYKSNQRAKKRRQTEARQQRQEQQQAERQQREEQEEEEAVNLAVGNMQQWISYLKTGKTFRTKLWQNEEIYDYVYIDGEKRGQKISLDEIDDLTKDDIGNVGRLAVLYTDTKIRWKSRRTQGITALKYGTIVYEVLMKNTSYNESVTEVEIGFVLTEGQSVSINKLIQDRNITLHRAYVPSTNIGPLPETGEYPIVGGWACEEYINDKVVARIPYTVYWKYQAVSSTIVGIALYQGTFSYATKSQISVIREQRSALHGANLLYQYKQLDNNIKEKIYGDNVKLFKETAAFFFPACYANQFKMTEGLSGIINPTLQQIKNAPKNAADKGWKATVTNLLFGTGFTPEDMNKVEKILDFGQGGKCNTYKDVLRGGEYATSGVILDESSIEELNEIKKILSKKVTIDSNDSFSKQYGKYIIGILGLGATATAPAVYKLWKENDIYQMMQLLLSSIGTVLTLAKSPIDTAKQIMKNLLSYIWKKAKEISSGWKWPVYFVVSMLNWLFSMKIAWNTSVNYILQFIDKNMFGLSSYMFAINVCAFFVAQIHVRENICYYLLVWSKQWYKGCAKNKQKEKQALYDEGLKF